jgi:lipoprotein NlpD
VDFRERALNREGLILALVLACLVSACRTGWEPEDNQRGAQSGYQLTKDGHYRVRRGDSLHVIAFNYGLDWRDIASWNHIRAPYIIHPDQELRLIPPPNHASSTVKAKTGAAAKPRTGGTAIPSKPPPATSSKAAISRPSETTTTALKEPHASTKSSPPQSSGSGTSTAPSKWQWPTAGKVTSTYKANDSSRNGIDISGKEGQAIIAAASGEVVYSGSGLIGYGELIIIKHSESLLSAYAHNNKRLVAEGQKVQMGARIADMGRNDRNQARLHFEIRVNGKPRNPLTYLPRR